MSAPPVARSYLFVPGDRPERFDKAWDSLADGVILDLEDAVAPDRKAQARASIADWLHPTRPAWVRVNATDTPWFDADLELAQRPGLAGFMLPKAEQVPSALISLCQARGLALLPIIETAVGMQAADRLASTPRVDRLVFGSLDFQVDLDITGDDDALLYFRSRIVLASRLASLPAPVDGVTTAVDDDALLRQDAERSRRLGFGAKLCIHPRQVAAVHAAFAPTAGERQWAERVLAVTAAAAGAAVALDGKMVDRPVSLKAARIAAAPAADRRLRGNSTG